MIVCKEMQKLRIELDKMDVEWIDKSQEWQAVKDIPEQGICRTHFNYNGKFYSVINGCGTYGGYDWIEKENKGLLGIVLPNGDVEGYLTAKDVLKIIKEDTK